MRANPVEFPQSGKSNMKGHELIFVASRIGYSQDMRGGVVQVQETVTQRVMATPGALAEMTAHCLALLPADLRATVLAIDYDKATSEGAHPDQPAKAQ